MRKLLKNEKAYAQLVPIVLAIVIVFALLFIGGYINGVIHVELEDAVGTGHPGPGSSEARTLSRMNNTSGNFDSTLDIVQVVVIITILAAAIGAIFLFTRFR